MRNRVKIKDIAEKCGLSNTLVSLVLNDKATLHGIKPDTQERVLFIARQMGYFENIPSDYKTVRSPAGSMVGMIVPEFRNHSLFEVCPLLNQAFSTIGLTFSIISQNKNEQRFETIIKDLKKMYCGLILYGEAADENTIHALKKTPYPFVVLEKKLSRHGINEVNTDSLEACKLVAMHILRLGYKKITVIEQKNYPNSIVNTQKLISSIQDKIPEIKISKHSIIIKPELDEANADEILKCLRPPEAAQLLLVKQSELVYPLLSFLKKMSFRVPSDVALIAMDNGIGFSLLDPPITRISRNYSALTLKTTQMLWSEVKNNGRGKYKRSVKINPELIIEKSCGAGL